MARHFVLNLDRFLGLWKNGASELSPGASSNMLNFKVNENRMLEKREGYESIVEFDSPCRGIWCGKMEGKSVFLAVVGDALYVSQEGFSSLLPLEGQVPGEGKVNFVPFFDGVYLLTGAGIRRFDGTTLSPIEPYVPLVMVSTTPSGAGTSFEEVNLLTPYFRQSFSADGTSCRFVPAVRSILNVKSVKVDGEEVDPKQYYLDGIESVLVFANPPKAGTDHIEATFELRRQEEVSHRILNCRYGIGFGGANDTRVFLYGNRESPAMRYHSGVVNGKPSFSYFPETGYTFVGTGAAITSVIRHYDRQLIFTEQAAYYSYLEYQTGAEGRLIASFPVLPLSDDRGCSAEGQAVLVENTPVTLTETGLFQWISTNIRDERNALCISDAVSPLLQELDAAKAILFYRKASSELYLLFGKRVLVYQTRLQVFYYYELSEAPLGFLESGSKTYYYTEKGIRRVGGETDGGESIFALWESGEMAFSASDKKKSVYSVTLAGKALSPSQTVFSLVGENGDRVETRTLSFPKGQEYAEVDLRLPLRRVQRVKAVIHVLGGGGTVVREIVLRGKVMDQ